MLELMNYEYPAIVYKPTCSECGRVINEQIGYFPEVVGYRTNGTKMEVLSPRLTPSECPHCGCTFKQIIYQYAPKLTQGAI